MLNEENDIIMNDVSEDSENEFWRNSFHSSKRVRHSSDRNTGNDYEIKELTSLEDTFDNSVESQNFDSQWRLEVITRRRQSIKNTRREDIEKLLRKTVVTNPALKLLHRLKDSFSESNEPLRFFVCTIIAVVTALLFVILMILIDWIVAQKQNVFNMISYSDESHERSCITVLITWITINILIVSFGSIIIYLIEPRSGGSGVPELRSFINGIALPRAVNFRSFVARLIGIIINPSADLPLGCSEPFMYVGGTIAAGISQGRASTFQFDCNIFKSFRNQAEKKDFVTAGATAGFCAAFGTPLAAVLFMMEQIATHWKQAGVWRVMWTAMVTSMTVVTASTLINPSYMNLASNTFGILVDMQMPLIDIVFAFFSGMLGGVLGALFRLLNRSINRIRVRYSSRRFHIMELIMLSIVSVCISLPLLWLEGERHCQNFTPAGTIRFPCSDGSSNSIGMILLQKPIDTFRALLHEPSDFFSPLTMFLFAVSWFFGSAIMYGCRIPGGIMMPNLIIGAAWGRVIGIGIESIFGNSSIAIRVEKFALFGAASQIAGCLDIFLTVPMMFTEATGTVQVGVVLAVVVLSAKITARMISSVDFYTMWSRLLQLAYLPMEADENPTHFLALDRLRASHLMSTPVTFIRVTESVDNLLNILKNTTHNGFPVVSQDVDEYNSGQLRGLIDRRSLLTLLEHKCLYTSDTRTPRTDDVDEDTFRRTRPPDLEKIRKNIRDEELYRRIVIADYMSIAPYVVQMHMRYRRVYAMFRTLGLRHLPVVTTRNNVVGIITRKDLLRYRWKSEKLCFGRVIECDFVVTKKVKKKSRSVNE